MTTSITPLHKLPTSLVAPFPNSEHINNPSSNHIYTKGTRALKGQEFQLPIWNKPTKQYLHKVDTKSHPAPLCPSATPTHNLFNCTHIRTTLSPLDLWTGPAGMMELMARWIDKLAGGPKAGTSDSPTSKGHGSG